jgi:hypothetical protein
MWAASQGLVKVDIKSRNLAVAHDDEINTGVRRRFTFRTRAPRQTCRVTQNLRVRHAAYRQNGDQSLVSRQRTCPVRRDQRTCRAARIAHSLQCRVPEFAALRRAGSPSQKTSGTLRLSSVARPLTSAPTDGRCWHADSSENSSSVPRWCGRGSDPRNGENGNSSFQVCWCIGQCLPCFDGPVLSDMGLLGRALRPHSMSAVGLRSPTGALQQVGGYL